LISCSQSGPDGGLSASAGWQGRMKPGGLERDRIGRETRQGQHLNRLRLRLRISGRMDEVAGVEFKMAMSRGEEPK
jgi:hypothetical protein